MHAVVEGPRSQRPGGLRGIPVALRAHGDPVADLAYRFAWLRQPQLRGCDQAPGFRLDDRIADAGTAAPPGVPQLGDELDGVGPGVRVGQRQEHMHRRGGHDHLDVRGVAGTPRAQREPVSGQDEIVEVDAVPLAHVATLPPPFMSIMGALRRPRP